MDKIIFWLFIFLAEFSAFIIFKDLADISQWVVQSSRELTMFVWYNRHVIALVAICSLLLSIVIWFKDRNVCSKSLLGLLIFIFVELFPETDVNRV